MITSTISPGYQVEELLVETVVEHSNALEKSSYKSFKQNVDAVALWAKAHLEHFLY